MVHEIQTVSVQKLIDPVLHNSSVIFYQGYEQMYVEKFYEVAVGSKEKSMKVVLCKTFPFDAFPRASLL